MNELRHHFVRHRNYMLGCLSGAFLAVIGGLVDQPIVTVAGSVICAGFCLQMIRMTVFSPNRG
jgi:hypothetical protein